MISLPFCAWCWYCGGGWDVLVVLWALVVPYRYGITNPGDPESPGFLSLVFVLNASSYLLIQGLCLMEGVRGASFVV